jgi:hypothetical protein
VISTLLGAIGYIKLGVVVFLVHLTFFSLVLLKTLVWIFSGYDLLELLDSNLSNLALIPLESTPRGGWIGVRRLKPAHKNSVRGCLADCQLGVSAGHFQRPLGGLGNGMQSFER